MKGALHKGVQNIEYGRMSQTYRACAPMIIVEDLNEYQSC